jgi:hypothetical protein
MDCRNQSNQAYPHERHPLQDAQWAGVQKPNMLNIQGIPQQRGTGNSDKEKPDTWMK